MKRTPATMFAAKLGILLIINSIVVILHGGEAVEAVCDQSSSFIIHALPGKPGSDGAPGEPGPKGEVGADGAPGPPGSVNDAAIEQLRGDVLEQVRILLVCKGITDNNPATSCKEIYQCNPNTPSGYYWVNTTTGPVQVYCEMDTNNCGNITGGWMRAAYIDMTNVNNTCPAGLNYTIASSKHMCTRSNALASTCSSVTFPTHGIPYTKVCGRARGYQYGHTYSYHSYQLDRNTLDSGYVSGLSLTFGSPRKHIWTFAAGLSKDYVFNSSNCPCALHSGPAVPPFVGEDYFCESGDTDVHDTQWYLDDPLWDSQGCASGSTCCNRGGPWFTTTLNQEVSDDIEMRVCHLFDSDGENIGLEQLEIFIN